MITHSSACVAAPYRRAHGTGQGQRCPLAFPFATRTARGAEACAARPRWTSLLNTWCSAAIRCAAPRASGGLLTRSRTSGEAHAEQPPSKLAPIMHIMSSNRIAAPALSALRGRALSAE